MPVSHRMVTIVAFGPRRSASRRAAVTLAPVDVPQNRPSSAGQPRRTFLTVEASTVRPETSEFDELGPVIFQSCLNGDI